MLKNLLATASFATLVIGFSGAAFADSSDYSSEYTSNYSSEYTSEYTTDYGTTAYDFDFEPSPVSMAEQKGTTSAV